MPMPARMTAQRVHFEWLGLALACLLITCPKLFGESKYVLVHALPIAGQRFVFGASEISGVRFPESKLTGSSLCASLSRLLKNRSVVLPPDGLHLIKGVKLEAATATSGIPLDALFKALNDHSIAGQGAPAFLEPLFVYQDGIRFYEDGSLISSTDNAYPVRLCVSPANKLDWKLFTNSCAANARLFCGDSIKTPPFENPQFFWCDILPQALSGPIDSYRVVMYLPENGMIIFECVSSPSPSSGSTLDSDFPTFFRHVLTGYGGSLEVFDVRK